MRPRFVLAIVALAAVFTAAGAPGAAPVERDLVYAEVDGQKLTFNLFRATKGEGPRPALVLIHSGGWSRGDKRTMTGFGIELAELGYTSFAINYRLAPKHLYPAAVDDCRLAVRWIRENAAKYNVDPQRLGAVGRSSGGHLALMLGLTDTEPSEELPFGSHSSRVQCVVSFSGPIDLTVPDLPIASLLTGRRFLGKTRREAPELWKKASPIAYVSPGDAPTLLCHGSKDPIVPAQQAVALLRALEKVNVYVDLVTVEGAGHGFTRNSPGDLRTRQAMREFLAQRLKP